MYSDEVQVETTVEAPREEVFDFLMNPYQIPLVLPGLIEVGDIPQLPLKVGDSFTYKYQVAGVVLEGKWTVTKVDRPSVYSAQTTGGAESEWTYTVSDEDGGTHVVLSVRYATPDSLLNKVSSAVLKRINKNDGESLMDNLKVVLEVKNEQG